MIAGDSVAGPPIINIDAGDGPPVVFGMERIPRVHGPLARRVASFTWNIL
jgi:hypothetical protein